MVLDGLGKSLRDVLKKVANASNIDEDLVKEITRDIQRALLQADVNVKLVLELTKEVERRALTEKPPAGKSSREHVIKIIYEELVRILGEPRHLSTGKQTIMMVGLYGQGKTTTTGKLARYFHKKGLSVGLVAADVHRPAAYDQLLQLGEKIGVEVYGEQGHKNAPKIVKEGMKLFHDRDVVIIDTSGRHALEEDLIQELKEVAAAAKPTERILVLDSQVGQQAGPQAKAFHDAVGVTSVILTKMDGTAKGGGALSAVLHRGTGDGDNPEDHAGALHPPGDVRADGGPEQDGAAEEGHVHAPRDGFIGGQGRPGSVAGEAGKVQDHHGLHDRGGDGGPQAHQVVEGGQDRPRRRGRHPRCQGAAQAVQPIEEDDEGLHGQPEAAETTDEADAVRRPGGRSVIRYVVIGHRAVTSGDFKLDDLAGGAGRLDILLRCINSAFFLSHDIRKDVEVHLVLQGPPVSPKTLRLVGSELRYLNPDERSTGALVRNALMQKVDTEVRSSPGIYISNRSYHDVLSVLSKESTLVYLKEDGEDIREFTFPEDVTFVLGDDRDLSEEEEDVLLKYGPSTVSLGPLSYHADHCITLVNNELDRRGQ
jgi:tRNA pseudouridine-54 N-methylase/signal recognition particle GTPase